LALQHPANADRDVLDDHGAVVQIVHEFDILQTEASECYFVLAIFGLEFALNMGGAEIDGYPWLPGA